MKSFFLVELIENASLLIVFSMLYERLWLSHTKAHANSRKILAGVVIGIIGVIIMLDPFILVPGLIFDTRSIILSVSGLFFGAIPTFIAMIPMMILRIIIGGDGIWMGLAVILLSGAVGILWRKFRPNWLDQKYLWELISLGVVVHVFMLLCTLILPKETILDTLKTIAIPVLIIYPVATMFMGWLMIYQYKSWQNRKAKEKLIVLEHRNSEILNSSNLLSVILDLEGKITFCNHYFLEITGYTSDEIMQSNWFDKLMPLETKSKIKDVFKQFLAGEISTDEYENDILKKDGNRLSISWHNILLKDEEKQTIGTASIGIDMTKRKELENELQIQHDHLEELVKARTKELQDKNEELESFNNLFIDREFRIKELKVKLDGMQNELDQIKSS